MGSKNKSKKAAKAEAKGKVMPGDIAYVPDPKKAPGPKSKKPFKVLTEPIVLGKAADPAFHPISGQAMKAPGVYLPDPGCKKCHGKGYVHDTFDGKPITLNCGCIKSRTKDPKESKAKVEAIAKDLTAALGPTKAIELVKAVIKGKAAAKAADVAPAVHQVKAKPVQVDLDGQRVSGVKKDHKVTHRDTFITKHYRVSVPMPMYEKFGEWNESKRTKWLKGRMKCINESASGADWEDESKALYKAVMGGLA